MLKTYLYIPEPLVEKINRAAKNQNKSKAEIIRLALESGIRSVQHQETASINALFKIAELGKKNKLKGPLDGAQKMDKYLWGKDWNKDE